jgi:cell division protein FtsZ
MGYAVMGTATGRGDRRALEAAQAAIASPLLEAGAIDGARGILINITGSSSLKLAEVNEASTIIQNAAHEDANIIFGAVLDEKMKDDVKITVIATGFKNDYPQRSGRGLSAAGSAISNMRTAAPFVPSIPTIVNQQKPVSAFADNAFEDDDEVVVHTPSSEPEPQPIAVSMSYRASSPSGAPEGQRSAESFEGDELDVPAFMRKPAR